MHLNRILTEVKMAGKGFIYLPVYSNDSLVNFCPHSSHDTFYRIKTDLRSAQGPF